MSWFTNKYKNTNFSAGGLRPTTILMSASNMLPRASKFIAPRKLDFRDMCIQTSNQGSTPHCAGYSMAGYIEVQNWKKLHYPEQIDGDQIYYEAKKIDSYAGDGTSLDMAATAAIQLKLIDGTIRFVNNSNENIQFAIHTHSVCVGGFMITDEWNSVNRETGEINDYGKEAETLGGHAVLICGYDDRGVYIQNSWGSTWGLWGFGLIPWSKVATQFMHGIVIFN